ncbi:ComEC/Rec2 family competence protein [Segatella copri]|uniref:ComEC/Rec2 family competence protein n=1 Tax=Segatella copri TaxID=165179 RepID=A0AA92V6A9_9BACT|nr:ComEC/Rec2 family competence protein [Segatella copri]
MMKELPLTPLMTISLTLTIGIIIAKWGYDDFNMHFWLIISIISCALGSIIFFLTEFLSKKAYFSRNHQFLIYSQCVMIHLCILSLGAFLTCKQIADSQTSTQLKNWQELSYLTRAKINTERYKSNIESKLVSLHVKQQDYAVIAAMALGDKSALDSNTRNSYSISGASHILAVSGLHIGIIFQLFIFLLGGRKYSVYTIILSLISIWTYVFLIGLPASAVRAAIMLSAYSLSLAFHRTGLPLNTLASAYIFMLFISPLYLFELSFQLSFLAVAPFCCSSHPFTPSSPSAAVSSVGHGDSFAFHWQPDRNPSGHRLHLRQNIVLFPSHQLHRHSRSNPHPISWSSLNPVLPTHVMGAIASVVAPLISLTSGALTSITQFLNTAIKLISMLPGASIENVKISLPQVFGLYAIILLIYALWRRIDKQKSSECKIP